MMRVAALLFVSFWLAAPAAAQSRQEIGQMRLYIQQLEERVRQLTGQNEQLAYELNHLRAQLAQGGAVAIPDQTGALAGQTLPGAPPAQGQVLAAPPQDLGGYSIAPNDPLIAPDGAIPGGPIDLSILAGGAAGQGVGDFGVPPDPGIPNSMQPAMLPGAPPRTAALSGTPRDEYDLAYGYILTGDYDLAEESFRNWLAAFPNDPQAADAQFWLGESHFQQREYRDAANSFLAVYKTGERSSKGPDALTKLGMSLAALGEKGAACATLAEVGRKYPGASQALMSRVDAEASRIGC